MSEQVSSDSDLVVLVDTDDNPIGLRGKRSCHEGEGILHRAISAFIFDESGRVLLQQRHAGKHLWGGYWSNACCTHPFYGEKTKTAAERRVREELGLTVDLKFAYKFEYRARFGEIGTEHELVSVFYGSVDQVPKVHPEEISDWRWEKPEEVDRLIKDESALVTPWFQLEWAELTARGFVKRG